PGGDRFLLDPLRVPGGGTGVRLLVQVEEMTGGGWPCDHAAFGVPRLEEPVYGEVLEFPVAELALQFLDGPPRPPVGVGGDVRGVEAFGAELVDDVRLLHGSGDEDAFGFDVPRPVGESRRGDGLVGRPHLGVGGHALVSWVELASSRSTSTWQGSSGGHQHMRSWPASSTRARGAKPMVRSANSR